MTAEDARELDPSSNAAAEIDALEREIQLLHRLRDKMASQPEGDVMIDAVTGLLDKRQAELERARRLPE